VVRGAALDAGSGCLSVKSTGLSSFGVAPRQHRFRNREYPNNKVEIRIIRHGPAAFLPQLSANRPHCLITWMLRS
jgi:hypothetical protein